MGKTYYDFHEIPIPSFAKVDKANDTVYVVLDTRNRRGDFKRRNIGKRAKADTMYVNENFRRFYPDIWDEHYGYREKAGGDLLHCGLYVSMLGIMYRNNLYSHMVKAFGPRISNGLADFAMYCIRWRHNSAMGLEEGMADQALFSGQAYSDSWYSHVFHEEMDGSQRSGFQKSWLEECKAMGINEVWVCIDGSNNDCDSQEATLATQGHAKSGKSKNIVSYMYAVAAGTGMPITWSTCYGGTVDSSAFRQMVKLLADNGIRVKGVILDRGFCCQSVLDGIKELGCMFVIMTDNDCLAYSTMMEKYATQIRWNTQHLINRKGLFGISDKVKPFRKSSDEVTACLYYDAANGSERSLRLIEKVFDAREDALKAIAEGRVPEISVEMSRYLAIDRDQDGNAVGVSYLHESFQGGINAKGYSVIICSEGIDAAEADRLYNLRDASEKVYSMIKSQLGFSVTRTSGDEAILNKMTLLFIATIARQEMVNASRELKIPTNSLIAELDRIHMVPSSSGGYYLPRKETMRASSFLSRYGIDTATIEAIVNDYGERKNNNSLERTLPPRPEKRKQGRPPKDDKPAADPDRPKRKAGRPKGSKNKKTLERERLLLQQGQPAQPAVPKKRGRPRKNGT